MLARQRWWTEPVALLRHARRRIGGAPLLAVGGVNALIFPLSIVTSIVLARALPKAEYGHLVYFYSGVGLLRLVMNLGLGTVVSRDVAAAWEDAPRLQAVVASTTLLRLVSIAALLPALLLASVFLPLDFLPLMAAGAIGASLADFVFAIIAGTRRTIDISLMSACQPVVYLALAGGAAAVGAAGRSGGSTALMALYGLSFGAMAALGLGLIARGGRLRWPGRAAIRPRYLRAALGHAAPSYLAALLPQAWSTAVAGAFGAAGQFERSAEFGIAFSVVTLALAITAPTLLTAFFPQASYLHGRGEQAALLAHIRAAFGLLLKGLIWIGLLLFACADLLVAVFGPAYRPAGPYIAALAPAAPLMGLLPIFTLSLFALGRPWRALLALLAQLAALGGVLALGGALTAERLIAAVLLSTGLGLALQAGMLMLTLRVTLLDRDLWRTLGIAAALALALRLLPPGLAPLWQALSALIVAGLYGLAVFNPGAALRALRRHDEVAA